MHSNSYRSSSFHNRGPINASANKRSVDVGFPKRHFSHSRCIVTGSTERGTWLGRTVRFIILLLFRIQWIRLALEELRLKFLSIPQIFIHFLIVILQVNIARFRCLLCCEITLLSPMVGLIRNAYPGLGFLYIHFHFDSYIILLIIASGMLYCGEE